MKLQKLTEDVEPDRLLISYSLFVFFAYTIDLVPIMVAMQLGKQASHKITVSVNVWESDVNLKCSLITNDRYEAKEYIF